MKHVRDLTTADRIRGFIDRELVDDGYEGDDPLLDGELDSLAVEQLVTFIHEAFGVEFRDDEVIARNFASVRTLARVVDEKRAARTGHA